MSRNKLLASRIREVFLNGKWIANTNFQAQILQVNKAQAVHKIEGLNSIAALTFHINYYLDGLLNAFDKGRLEISDQYSFNMPPIETEADWTSLVNRFLNNAQAFADRIEQMDDGVFDQAFIDEKYGSYLRNVEGVIEHSYYHLGQIVLIGNLVRKKES